MQYSLFAPSITGEKEQPVQASKSPSYGDPNNASDGSMYSRWYCLREILYEQYLWDMRCWHKPKYQYTKEEIMEHIQSWIKDHEEGNWTYNCGHCLYCMRKLLETKGATLEEIAGYVMRNNNIKYYNQIGTWNNGFDE